MINMNFDKHYDKHETCHSADSVFILNPHSPHTQSWLILQFSILEANDDPAHPSLHPSCNTIRTKCYHTEKPIVRTGRKRKHLLEEFESFDHPTIA